MPKSVEAPLVHVADEQARRRGRANPKPARARNMADWPHCVPEDGVHVAIVVKQPAADVLRAQVLLGLRDDGLDGHCDCLRLISMYNSAKGNMDGGDRYGKLLYNRLCEIVIRMDYVGVE